MQVETYISEDTEKTVTNPEDIAEWKAKVEALGLEGQKNLMEGAKSVMPFASMTKEQIAIYKAMFPSTSSLVDFGKEAIPLRALSILALCVQENYFEKIEIWYSPTGDDPIGIGFKGNQRYLLVRWGNALVSYAELKKQSMEILMNKARATCLREIATAKARLENLEAEVLEGLNASWHWTT